MRTQLVEVRIAPLLAARGADVGVRSSFLDLITNAAQHYPASVYNPPGNLASTGTAVVPLPPPGSSSSANTAAATANAPALNFRAGGYELSVGGAAGSGLYRASGNNAGEIGASFQIDGLRDGAKSFFGNLRGKVEETVQRVGTPRAE